MRALSIKNPWALLIAHGIKPIENRTFKIHFRGRIYIHCSAKSLHGYIKAMFTDQQWNALSTEQRFMIGGKWPNGCIIGEVDIIDCVRNHKSVWAEHKTTRIRKLNGVKIEVEVPVYNWILANPVLYDKPIENVKGALSFWEYKSD
jgi:hypothetical protein